MTGAGSYLDAASTEPLHPAAREVLLSALEDGWADPTRLYREGRQARLLLDRAREIAAGHLGARPDEIAFTPSGTAAVHAGVLGALKAGRRRGSRVVVGAVEHSSVFDAVGFVRRSGPDDAADVAPVDEYGRVDVDAFVAATTPEDTVLACLQSANHEVGTRQPVDQVAVALADRRGRAVPLLVDAAQSVGRDDLPRHWQLLTASAHKWGGPAGVGVLAVRTGTRFESASPTDQRSVGGLAGVEVGMLDLPSVLAAVAALDAREAERHELAGRHRAWIDELRTAFAALPDAQVVGAPDDRLPHLMTVSFLGVDGETLVTELDRAGLSVTSGSSCTSSTLQPSHVLVAMGVLTQGNVRVSLHRGSTHADVDALLATLPGVVAAVRARHAAVVPHERVAEKAGEVPEGSVLDYRGRPCPAPVIGIAKAVQDVPVGAEVAVDADDPAAPGDIAAFARMRGHTFVSATARPDGATRITIRRSV